MGGEGGGWGREARGGVACEERERGGKKGRRGRGGTMGIQV